MRVASCLLSTLFVVPLSCLATGNGEGLRPFQQIPELPSATSLTQGDTSYELPEDLDSMPFLSGGVALDNFGGQDDQGRLATAVNVRGLLASSDLLSLRSMGWRSRGTTTGRPITWASGPGRRGPGSCSRTCPMSWVTN